MSYTNQTQHYGLPQYVGTDVPAWLTDVNGAFATIDQGMNAAKTQADSAATSAGQAANDIVSINSTLGTQAGQISAAAGAAAAAQTTANSADGKADANAQSISGLDTRVTALEQGGTPTGGFDTDLVTMQADGSIMNYAPPVGKIPVAVIPKSGFGAALGLTFMLFRDASNGFKIARMSTTGTTSGEQLVITSPISAAIDLIVLLINEPV